MPLPLAQVLGLGAHYTRAELEATVDDDGGVDVAEPKNITRFAIPVPMSQSPTPKLRVGGQVVPLPVLDQVPVRVRALSARGTAAGPISGNSARWTSSANGPVCRGQLTMPS